MTHDMIHSCYSFHSYAPKSLTSDAPKSLATLPYAVLIHTYQSLG